jgi:hypothetical protein
MEGDKLADMEALIARSDVSPEEQTQIRKVVRGEDREIDSDLTKEGAEDHKDIRALIGDMTVAQKVKLALLGNSICRALLVTDRNRMVQEFVLRNPKIQLNEIEAFSKNPNTTENVIRLISGTKEWMAEYQIKLGLVLNPKTPPDIALKWLRFLMPNELKRVAKSKGIPQVVAVAAKKAVSDSRKT